MRFIVVLCSSVGLAAISACSRSQEAPPPAAASRVVVDGDSPRYRRSYTAADRDRMLEAMRSVAAGYESTDPPEPAKDGRRWSDVGAALSDACAEVGVAVVLSTNIDGGYRVTLKTLDDRTGVVEVLRKPAPEIYTATAVIGRLTRQTEREQALLEAFDRYMLAYGRKRSFE